ncbi:MAG: sugar transferase [Negativicutes bacterium]|nr:sugar transferase [Negativicutes bacterium]
MRKRFPILRNLILLTGDIGILLIAAYFATIIVFIDRSLPTYTHYDYIIILMIVAAGFLLNINGLLSLEGKKYSEIILSLAITVLNLLIIMMATSFFVREFNYSRSVLAITAILQFVLLAIWNYIFWWMERRSLPQDVLVIGNQAECARVIARLSNQPQLNYKIRYICTDRDNENWKKIAGYIDLIIICADLSLKEKSKIVHFCHVNSKQILLVPDVYELFCSGVELDKIDDIPVFIPRYLRPTLEQRFLKRTLDLVIAGTAILLLWPICILLAIAIKIDDPGPILYSQERFGLNEVKFKIYKFRTMHQNAEKISGPMLATDNDPRITTVGRFLRGVRLDELPQFINVLLGNMSIVGPRPERPFFVEQFAKKIPEYIYRHNVKPGITGLAQVYGKYNTDPYDKLVYDLIYIQKCNIFTDLIIIIQTIKVLVTKSSAGGVSGLNKVETDLSRYKIGGVG